MPNSRDGTKKRKPRGDQRGAARASGNPRLQFLRGFLKHPVMVGSIIPSSRTVIERMLAPVDWQNTRLFVEYGPGVGTFTRPILEKLAKDATLLTIDTNSEFNEFLEQSIDDPRRFAVTGSAADVESILAERGFNRRMCCRHPILDLAAGLGEAIGEQPPRSSGRAARPRL